MASAAEIIIHPNDLLRQVCAPVVSFDAELLELSQIMRVTMAAAAGLGLAGPQIGVSKRVACVGKFFMVNPKIIWRSEAQSLMNEGCLSIPGERIPVMRPSSVEVEYYEVSGIAKKIRLSDRMAKCAQHEIDHLDGILIVDKLHFAEAA